MRDRGLDSRCGNGPELQPPRDRFFSFGNNSHKLHFAGIVNIISTEKNTTF